MNSSRSPPPTPTLSEPMEKRSRNDTGEICTDGDDETQSPQPDTNKLGVMQHGQSNNSIISMEDDDFASDDEKVNWSHRFFGFCSTKRTNKLGAAAVSLPVITTVLKDFHLDCFETWESEDISPSPCVK